jgi:hypothetical protein
MHCHHSLQFLAECEGNYLAHKQGVNQHVVISSPETTLALLLCHRPCCPCTPAAAPLVLCWTLVMV